MTKEQVIAMAREAGFSVKNFKPPVVAAQHSNGSWVSVGDELERFAALVRNAALDEANQIDWTEVMREGQLVTWGDASTLGYRVFEKLESLKEPTT